MFVMEKKNNSSHRLGQPKKQNCKKKKTLIIWASLNAEARQTLRQGLDQTKPIKKTKRRRIKEDHKHIKEKKKNNGIKIKVSIGKKRRKIKK